MRGAFTLRDAKRHYLSLKAPGGYRGGGFALRKGGEGILLGAGDIKGVGEILGGDAHVIVVKRIP